MSKKIDRLIHLINQLERKVYEPLFDKNYYEAGHWDYVCYGFKAFLQHLEEAHKILGNNKAKFIDVGCGLGSKVHLAGLYFDSYGIELNQKYCKVAKEINTPRKFFKYGRYEDLDGKNRIFKKDALTFDYNPYDVIYFFRPLSEQPLQEKLEGRIFETAQPGAIIIPIFAQSRFPKHIRHLPTPSKELYVKVMNDKKANRLHNRVKNLF